MAGLAVELPRLLGDFNLPAPYLDAGSEIADRFVVTVAAMGLVQIMQSPAHSSDNTIDLVFLLEQWQHVLYLRETWFIPCYGQITHWWAQILMSHPPPSTGKPRLLDWLTPDDWWAQLGSKGSIHIISENLLLCLIEALVVTWLHLLYIGLQPYSRVNGSSGGLCL